jgi:hypothetical protein
MDKVRFERWGYEGKCFYNACTRLNADPEKLLYVEGYLMPVCIYHAWVKEIATGMVREVTIRKSWFKQFSPTLEWKYIGKEFTHDQMLERLLIKLHHSPILTEEEEENLWESIPVGDGEEKLWALLGRRQLADDSGFFRWERAR